MSVDFNIPGRDLPAAIDDFLDHQRNQTRRRQMLLVLGDCLEQMKHIPDGSIDLIATDLPYGTTQNKWDIIIPFEPLWFQYKRILKSTGSVILTATQPFTSQLVTSNMALFKYDLVWEKTIASGQLNVRRQPLRTHESILIFGRGRGTYNEQCTEGKPYFIKRKVTFKGEGYGRQADSSKTNTGFRHAKSVITISNPRNKDGHPTQKPIALMEYIIKCYSNPNDVVLDSCMGSGTTGVAAKLLDRNFIGIELDESYFTTAKNRICPETT